MALESEIIQTELKMSTINKDNFDLKKQNEILSSKVQEVSEPFIIFLYFFSLIFFIDAK